MLSEEEYLGKPKVKRETKTGYKKNLKTLASTGYNLKT